MWPYFVHMGNVETKIEEWEKMECDTARDLEIKEKRIEEFNSVLRKAKRDIERETGGIISFPDDMAPGIQSELNPEKQTRTDLIKTLIMRYLEKTEGKGDFPGCTIFLLEDPEVQEGSEGTIIWTDYHGKARTTKRKSIQNRFNKYKKEWKLTI